MGDYEPTRQRHIAHMLGQLGEHFERVSWSADRLRHERTARLRELVALAQERSSWHRHRLRGVDAQALDVDDLHTLPVMTKADLMAHFDAIVTDARVRLADVDAHIEQLKSDAYFLDDMHAVASGGSSGVRGVFVWGWDAWATVQLATVRRSLLDRIGDPQLASRSPVAMVVAADNATHFTSALAQTFATGAIETHRFPITLPLDAVVDGLNRVGGDILATYPSMLEALVLEAQAGRLRIEPRRILTMAEPLFVETRQAAEQLWGAPVGNLWGTSENGVIATGCFKSAGMHLSDDLVIIEPVDAGGEPVPPGVRSDKVYVTNLFNPLLPLIRYEITDEVTFVSEPCACGSVYSRIADIEGRNDDVFTYAGGLAVHPHVFRSVLAQVAAISEYQVHQTAVGAEILVCASSAVDTRRITADVTQALARLGWSEPVVSARVVERIPRLDTGKLKRFVPLPSDARA
ncbi:MAG TPA: hypothetical protein VLJ42_06020 [Solirubrobacteraceae bacterium]|nr:hypothetical protein [Solirubrobacteraceae bacterium]